MKERIDTTINKKTLDEMKEYMFKEDMYLNELIEKTWEIYKIYLKSFDNREEK